MKTFTKGTIKSRLAAFVASIPTDQDIAEWLLENGVPLECNAEVGDNAGRSGNCPMAVMTYIALGLNPQTYGVGAGESYVRIFRRNPDPFVETVQDWPVSVSNFINEFDSVDASTQS